MNLFAASEIRPAMRCVIAVVVLSLAMAARLSAADDAAAIQAKMKAAQAAVQSFRMQISAPGTTGIATIFNNPKRMHMRMASGPMTVEMYIADGYVYQNIANTGWKKQLLPAGAALVDIQRAFDGNTAFSVAPDVTDGGVTYGAITLQLSAAPVPGAPPAPPLTITCSYDKQSYLMHACTSTYATETFSGYDDPANVVTLPPELATAIDTGPPRPQASPPPAASPAPSHAP
jgi:hypothetical protein